MFLETPALWPALVAFVVFCAPMLVTDAREQRLPLPLNLGLIASGVTLLPMASIWQGWEALLAAGSTSLGLTILALILFVVARGHLGFGDVILTAGLALYGGYVSPFAALGGFWFGSLGTLLWALLRRKRGVLGPVPFGPGLILGTLAALVVPFPL